jgi:hypothetical protein
MIELTLLIEYLSSTSEPVATAQEFRFFNGLEHVGLVRDGSTYN